MVSYPPPTPPPEEGECPPPPDRGGPDRPQGNLGGHLGKMFLNWGGNSSPLKHHKLQQQQQQHQYQHQHQHFPPGSLGDPWGELFFFRPRCFASVAHCAGIWRGSPHPPSPGLEGGHPFFKNGPNLGYGPSVGGRPALKFSLCKMPLRQDIRALVIIGEGEGLKEKNRSPTRPSGENAACNHLKVKLHSNMACAC